MKKIDNDPDYVPHSSDESVSDNDIIDTEEKEGKYEEEEEEDEYEDEDEDEDEDEMYGNIMFIINNNKHLAFPPVISSNIMKKRAQEHVDANKPNKKMKYDKILQQYSKSEKEYFQSLSEDEKDKILNLENKLEDDNSNEIEPMRFKFLKLDLSQPTKNIVLSKLNQLNKMSPSSGEYSKLHNWLTTLSKVPIGKYHQQPVQHSDGDISQYLQNIKKSIDDNIYGHEETKEQVIRILAQWISNPDSNGYVIGIQGSPGVGKTKLIKDGICKAMGYPLSFVSLGGISDSSYLNGHNYTYEGSTHGKIVESLIKARVMNPVFLFDELDKVSNTSRGDEIINTLIHLTDPVQNDRYNDKYFEEIDIDLSKSLIIFTYNDENNINPILKDRMITIKVGGYNSKEKLSLCKNYIIPELLPQYNMKKEDIIFQDDVLNVIIESYSKDDGVRNIKRILNNILSWINMMKYISIDNVVIKTPFVVNREFFSKYCKNTETNKTDVILAMYT
jgi:ATP-dependent Lon protease